MAINLKTFCQFTVRQDKLLSPKKLSVLYTEAVDNSVYKKTVVVLCSPPFRLFHQLTKN